MTYTNTRIRPEYLGKLRALAKSQRRSMIQQLELLIDKAVSGEHTGEGE